MYMYLFLCLKLHSITSHSQSGLIYIQLVIFLLQINTIIKFLFFPTLFPIAIFPIDLCGNCSNNFQLDTSVCLSSMALTNSISRWNFSLRTDFGQIISVGERTDTITLTIKVGIGLH